MISLVSGSKLYPVVALEGLSPVCISEPAPATRSRDRKDVLALPAVIREPAPVSLNHCPQLPALNLLWRGCWYALLLGITVVAYMVCVC